MWIKLKKSGIISNNKSHEDNYNIIIITKRIEVYIKKNKKVR